MTDGAQAEVAKCYLSGVQCVTVLYDGSSVQLLSNCGAVGGWEFVSENRHKQVAAADVDSAATTHTQQYLTRRVPQYLDSGMHVLQPFTQQSILIQSHWAGQP